MDFSFNPFAAQDKYDMQKGKNILWSDNKGNIYTFKNQHEGNIITLIFDCLSSKHHDVNIVHLISFQWSPDFCLVVRLFRAA